jgi:hypothetical protein
MPPDVTAQARSLLAEFYAGGAGADEALAALLACVRPSVRGWLKKKGAAGGELEEMSGRPSQNSSRSPTLSPAFSPAEPGRPRPSTRIPGLGGGPCPGRPNSDRQKPSASTGQNATQARRHITLPS